MGLTLKKMIPWGIDPLFSHKYWGVRASDENYHNPSKDRIYEMAIFDIQMYSSGNYTTKNHAYQRPSYATSSVNSSLTPNKANDGNPSTKWRSDRKVQEYQMWYTELETKELIRFLVIRFNNKHAPQKFELIYSDDENNWTILQEFSALQNNEEQLFVITEV